PPSPTAPHAVLRPFADHAAAPELDGRVQPLAREGDVLLALAAAHGVLYDLVLDARLIERLLHLPARVRTLDPHRAAAVQLDRQLGDLRSLRVGPAELGRASGETGTRNRARRLALGPPGGSRRGR